ncbi:MAG TPA: hypothetical protein VE135_09290 [Pyrinomonadaceae bacterium]|nr:hypothetical protein [Pyrinomonadaceae bacterium]
MENAAQVFSAEGRQSFAEEMGDVPELAATQLPDDLRGPSQERGTGRRNATQLGDRASDLILAMLLVVEPRHLNDVHRRRPGRQDVLCDFRIDPRTPLAAAPFAHEVVRRDEGQKQTGPSQRVVDPQSPVVETADVLRVEKRNEGATAGELPMLCEQFLDEATDPAPEVVLAGVRDEEVEQVRVTRHALTP